MAQFPKCKIKMDKSFHEMYLHSIQENLNWFQELTGHFISTFPITIHILCFTAIDSIHMT